MKKIDDLINQSLNLFKKNDLNNALKTLESIEDKNDHRKYFLIGTIYISLRKIELAEKNLIHANEINGNNPSILHNLGTLMAIKKDFKSAKNFYLQAIKINNNIDSLYELGRLFDDENNFEEAKKYFEMVLEKNKNHKMSNLRIGKIYMKINEFKKGLQYIQKATGFIRFSEEGFKII